MSGSNPRSFYPDAINVRIESEVGEWLDMLAFRYCKGRRSEIVRTIVKMYMKEHPTIDEQTDIDFSFI